MDISIKYIKMCEKAKELQECYRTDEFAKIQEKSGYWWNDFFACKDHKTQLRPMQLYKDPCPAVEGNLCLRRSNEIWLPRQDQLQDMLFCWIGDMIKEFYLWFVEDVVCKQHFIGMEQLWLAFVMEKKYHKIWDGEDWVERR